MLTLTRLYGWLTVKIPTGFGGLIKNDKLNQDHIKQPSTNEYNLFANSCLLQTLLFQKNNYS
jgi:hypothetical protein